MLLDVVCLVVLLLLLAHELAARLYAAKPYGVS